MGHARALLTLSPELAGKLASDAAEHGWSVREVEHRAQQFAAGKLPATSKKTGAGKARQQADIAALETELSESLGTRVSVVHGRSGKGRLVIHYSGLDTARKSVVTGQSGAVSVELGGRRIIKKKKQQK